VQNDGHKKGAKSDDKSVDSVRNQDFFNAGLSPYPHTTTSQEHQIGHPPRVPTLYARPKRKTATTMKTKWKLVTNRKEKLLRDTRSSK